nr:MAG TPA: tail tape measure protein [Bacteriophage sp.]
MAQRYDIIHIDFQANARNANAAIESMRQECERCNKQVKDLQKKLKDGIEANLPSSQIQKLRDNLDAATKQARQFNKAYGELAKGMRVLDQGIKAFNDGSLATMNAAFQKAVYNAAKLTRSRLNRSSASYKKDREEMTALMDATQQYYASIQTDTQKVLDTISKGGKVSRQALTEELQQQKDLLNVLSEKDRGYKRTVEQVATLEHELKKMGGSYEFVRKHITDTKRVSSETLRTMYTELEQTNRAGKVSTSIMRENKQAMKEIRAEQERRVQKVLGGNLGRQSEGDIRQAIASAKELIQVYGTSSKRAQTLAAQIVNAESYLKTVGVEGARAARQQADAALQAADKYKLMQDRMSNITKLSRGAFTETQRFWQEQLDGSKRGSTAYKEAERNLKALANEQQRLNTLQLQKSTKQLERKNLGLLSEKELQASIAAAKQLAQSMKPGDQAYKDLVNNIMRAEKYVKEFGLEGQRSSRMAVEQMQAMNDRMSHLSKLSDGALEETRKFWQTQRDGAERGSKAYETYEKKLNATIKRQQELATAQNKKSADTLLGGTSIVQNMGEGEIRKAIDAAREYQKTLQADSDAYTSLSKAIFNAEEYLRKYGIEADKAKLKEEQLKATMTQRLTSLMTLSDSALAETKKFWAEQMQGAERTSIAYKEAEANVRRIAEVENKHKAASSMRVMAKPGNYSDAEIRQAANAMEKLRDAQAHGSQMWERYNRLVEEGRKYLSDWANADRIMKYEGQMQKLTTLSDSALAETKKFWAEMVAGAEKGSAELAGYEANLEKVTQEERERRQLNNEMSVQKLGGNLSKLSESEIRQAIEAGKQLIQTYNTADPAAKKLAQQIVTAEQHLKQYGLEAERSAVREREAVKKAADERAKANQLMESQLQNSSSLTASALKAQESYWKRLIDDPKTAASSLSQYKANLDKVHLAQKLMMEDAGGKALSFFRNGTGDASAEEIRTQAEALKKYRDSLPQQTNADVIREINGYLAQTGQAAQGAAGPMMSLRDAFRMGLQGAANIFKGTPEQLKQAKQVLEETLATTEKGSHRYEQLRRALDGVALEEKRVGGVTKEMQAVLDAPKGRSFNELKVAVEQGRKALNDMSRTTKEGQKAYDELAEKVRNADLEMKNLGNESKGTTSAFEKAVSRLKTYITLYMGTAVAIQKIGGAMGDMMTLSDKMGEVRKTTGFTADQVGRLSDNLAKLDTRTPIQDLMDMAAAAGQLGLNTEEDVRGFTEAANMLHVALPEMGEEGATEMMKVALATGEVNKIRKQMEDGTVQGSSATAVAMEKIASTIDRLRATTAAAAQPVADFVKRVGAVGAQSGITVDQVAALGATVDELGMGTEMAATAISRMIPAIKNHAFDIARAIGVTPKTIRDLYDSGKAMDVILMILQHIHDQNLNPDGIEKLLGTGGMGEIMKELDQQGARAGIVFAGLSQNVGELRKNLGTAKKAYADNIAIQQEYDKMNDTTAARWERLKNQLQEFFVNDSSQRFFGGIISALRVLVNFITDDGPIGRALRYTVVYLAMLKAKWTEAIGSGIMYLGKLIFTTKASTVASTADATAKAFETTSTVALGNANATAAAKTNLFTTAWRRLNAAQKANVIAAVAMAVVFLTMTAIKYVRQLASMTRAQKELNKVQDQAEVKAAEESGRLENLRKIVNDNTRSVKERKAAILEIQKAVPNYIATVNGEGNAYKRNTKLLTAYINKLKEKALVEGAKEEMQSLGKEVAHTTVEIYKQEKAIEDRSKEAAGAMQARPQTSQGTAAPVSVQARAAASMEIWGMKSKLRSLQNKNREANDALQALQDSFGEQIAESDLANSLGKKGKGKGNGNGSGTGGGGGISGGGGGGTDKNNPWGDNPDAASTNWSKMNGKDLVARRKQMNEFVLALQGDTDVESVLSEDPALMAAIKKGAVKKDADSVMAWYDKQRLAIQQVLHSRALSNTGNWQDPKQAHRRAKSISKLVKDDMAYYMDELDAYYTEQKSQIEDAQNSGEITEEEGWRRMLQNEQVYRQKRAELQQLYSKNSKEVTQQEADTIYEILADRTGDSVAFIKSNIGTTVNLIKQVGDKSAPAMRKIYGDLDKGVEQDFLKMRAAVKKQLDAIEEIVSKERPFDGIVKNLRQNVEKMGLLYTDLDKRKEKILLSGKGYGSDEMQNLNAEYGTQRNPRLTFLLQQSEDAYNMTWERLVNNMRVSGFGDWADAILNNEHAEDMKEALLAQLHTVFDTVQDAIKKESSEVKKQVDIAWNDTQNALLPGGKSMKQLYEAAASALGIEQQSVSRANSLIGAGVASERVADKLAIKQLEVQLHMQEHYYALVRKIGRQRIDDLNRLAKQKEEQGKLDEAEQHRLDAKHAAMSLDLSISEEETELAKQRADLNARAEESQNRLYTSLKEWGTLLSSSMQSLFEASNTGAADYYNNLAKMRLTGEGSAGGTYVVIDNAGTKDAAAHYENLDGEEALKRQLEIEQHNSVADAWKKVMDDINKKISDQITDWMNASLQTQSIDANTAALEQNTAALYATRPYETNDFTNPDRDKNGMAIDKEGKVIYPIAPEENPQNDNDPSTWPRARRKRAGLPVDGEPMDETTPIWQMTPEQREEYEQNIAGLWTAYKDYGISAETEKAEALQGVPGYTPDIRSDEQMESIASQNMQVAQSKIDASNAATQAVLANNKKQQQSTADTQGKEVRGTKSTFAAMAAAMNMYGIAYQTMSNDNMSSTQKFLTFALQSAGQVAIAMLTTNMLQTDAQSKVELPGILGKAASQLGPVAGPIAFAAMSALLGGLMGMAMSKVSKSKSQIAQVTGASVSAGRLSTGMLTYAEGNVNEFTDPSSLTPGQRYNVDAADGKTYRARYMGANPTTHLTNGPEFHLVGERGREAIIDANTTRRLQMNDTGIWQAIQTLYNGGRVRATRQRGGGMSNFADGNLDEFADGASAQGSAGSAQPAFTDMLAAIQASLDRNSEVMEKAVRNGIKGVFNVYGKGGIIDSYDTGKKNVGRYGEKY